MDLQTFFFSIKHKTSIIFIHNIVQLKQNENGMNCGLYIIILGFF